MGMSASQARYLGLTARRTDNEFQAQQLTQQRASLANEMDTIATDYSTAMSNTNLLFVKTSSSGTTSTKLTYDIITSTDIVNGLGMRVVDQNGRVVVPQAIDFDALKQKAQDTYNNAISNNALYSVEQVGNSSIQSLLTGSNFISTYFATAGNSVLDKDGNEVLPDSLSSKINNLSAPELFSYFEKNGLSLSNTSNIASSRYTEDDSAAAATYETTIADLEAQRTQNSYMVDEQCTDAEYLEKQLRSGKWSIEKVEGDSGSSNYGEWQTFNWSASSSISSSLDTSDDAAAEAKYQARANFFARQDKALELKQHQLESEHSAIMTELDSVKKVIEKNVEGSFKTFA